ncbi:MAG: sigma-70 family RNA polymerase sigma factor [Acidobacteriia bacterium]|nr:sigma-70 family RNA polymerase sigma factor [Terriglobia bacterium]
MESQDAAALTRVLGGDREAFRVLVERYSKMVFSLAFRMTGNEDDAADVVQETFLRAYRGLDRFESRSSMATWLFRIATNCSLTTLERRKTQPQPAPVAQDDEDPPEERLLSPRPGPEALAYSGELQARIDTAMKTLSPVEHTAFVLRHFEGRPIEEIAAALQVKEGAAKQSVLRAVNKMRRALEPVVRPAR